MSVGRSKLRLLNSVKAKELVHKELKGDAKISARNEALGTLSGL